MKRWVVAAVAIVLVVAASYLARAGLAAWSGASRPIRVGLLHSLSGPLASNERPMVDAETLAIEEINAAGGLLGRPVEFVVVDGKSDPDEFAREAERLVRDARVSVIFGCWSSPCRKGVKEVVEKANHLLVYPVAYEGLEQSPNILYVGAVAGQQVIPAVKWAGDTLHARSFFLVGTDTLTARAVHEVVKDELKALGGTLAGEEFVRLGAGDSEVSGAVDAIAKAKPDVVISTLEGDANQPFYRRTRVDGGALRKIPVIAYVVAEDDLKQLPAKEMVNDFCVCNYFQTVRRDRNQDFVRRFKARFGESASTSDASATAYDSVHLWAQAVADAGTDETGLVRDALLRQSFDAPEGIIAVDRETQHTWRPLYIGRVRRDGLVDVVESFEDPIRPAPFPFSRTRQEWEQFVEGLHRKWGGRWIAPAEDPSGRGTARAK